MLVPTPHVKPPLMLDQSNGAQRVTVMVLKLMLMLLEPEVRPFFASVRAVT